MKTPRLSVHLKADSLTPPLLIVTFELPADHETLSSHPFPREPQETGSCDPVVYTAMERPITAVTWQVTGTDRTMWALFSNKCLPLRPMIVSQYIYLKCLKMYSGFRFRARLLWFIWFQSAYKEMNRWYFFSFDLGVSGGIWMSCLISAGYISKNKKREK